MTAGTLFVVATPIGNLEDITLRALRILRDADEIAAEDTRRTARLLSHHGIDTPTVSFHQHNTRTRVPQLLSRLVEGRKIALVTDAGTPSISDPGVELVRACIERGVRIDPIPGPSAPIAAAIVSGFPLEPLTVFGFPPAKSSERKKWLEVLAVLPNTVSFFEAPHRVRATLTEASTLLGERPIVVARELTKLHQEMIRGSASSVIEALGIPRGEFTIVVGPKPPEEKQQSAITDEELFAEFGLMTKFEAVTRRGAITELAKRHGKTTRDVYAAIERVKKIR